MAIDLQQIKVPVFEDVNDQPTAPTASSPGNGSHLIKQYNSLVTAVEQYIGTVQEDVTALTQKSVNRWTVTDNDFYASAEDRVIFYTNQPIANKSVYYLYLPNNPAPGTSVGFINTNQSIEIELKPISGEIYFQGTAYQRLYIADMYKHHTIVFTQQIGWVSTNNDVYSDVLSSNYNT